MSVPGKIPAARLAATATAILLGVPDARAADLDPCAFLNVVLTTPSYSGCSDPAFAELDGTPCRDLTSEPIEGLSFLWIIASQRDGFPNGLGGFQLGIRHSLEATGWNLCSGGSEIKDPHWPASETSIAMWCVPESAAPRPSTSSPACS